MEHSCRGPEFRSLSGGSKLPVASTPGDLTCSSDPHGHLYTHGIHVYRYIHMNKIDTHTACNSFCRLSHDVVLVGLELCVEQVGLFAC